MSGRGRPRLSQHFLVNRRAARQIADSLRAPPDGDVLEIGPGRGALTEHLLERDWRVTVVELDRALAASLEARWGERSDFRVIEADILDFELNSTTELGHAWFVVGNLPYAITTPILFRVLDWIETGPVAEIVFMVQREVAERLVADPGTKSYGALTVGVQLQADVELLFDLAPGSFRPSPKVRSSVVRLTPVDRALTAERRSRVRVLVRQAFGLRRKQLQKILRSLPGFAVDPGEAVRLGAAARIDLERRPETLSVEEWLRLDEALADFASARRPSG